MTKLAPAAMAMIGGIAYAERAIAAAQAAIPKWTKLTIPSAWKARIKAVATSAETAPADTARTAPSTVHDAERVHSAIIAIGTAAVFLRDLMSY